MVKKGSKKTAGSGEGKSVIRRGETYRLLRAAVVSGVFPEGSVLPSERELMLRYKVTRTTIRRALAKLVASGHLICHPRIGYRVAPATRNGRPVKGCGIGLILHGMPDMGKGPFATAVEQAVADAGHVLMVGASGNNVARENDVIRRLAAVGMDGLIITPACLSASAVESDEAANGTTAIGQWIREGRPVVAQGHPGRWALPDDLSSRCSMVDVDNAEGIRLLLVELAALGHRTAGFICQDPLEGSERFAAFRRLAPSFDIRTKREWWIERAGITSENADAVLDPLLGSDDLPTALLCSHDDNALLLLEQLRGHGLRCPEDISITGFENRSLRGDVAMAGLTTIDGNSAYQGHESMRMLIEQFADPSAPNEVVRAPVMLIDRGSIAPPREQTSRSRSTVLSGSLEK